jgi:hypothetical protein
MPKGPRGERRPADVTARAVMILGALFRLVRDSPDEPRTDLDGSDLLDCPEARMEGVDGYRHCGLPKWRRGPDLAVFLGIRAQSSRRLHLNA